MSNHEFHLLEKNEKGKIANIIYYGSWFIVNNGYLSWSFIILSMNNATSYKLIRF